MIKESRKLSIMDPNTTTSILNMLLMVAFLSIALRAFTLYIQLRSPRLFILGLSMTVIALTAGADFASGLLTNIRLDTDWFLYIGQFVSFTFIFLSLLFRSTPSLRRLMYWHILTTGLLLFLLVLAPVLPDFPNTLTQFTLSSTRCIICFILFSYYISSLISKETRFSILISVAFLLLSIGYCLILPKLLVSHAEFLDQIGDMTRILGIIVLLSAYMT